MGMELELEVELGGVAGLPATMYHRLLIMQKDTSLFKEKYE